MRGLRQCSGVLGRGGGDIEEARGGQSINHLVCGVIEVVHAATGSVPLLT